MNTPISPAVAEAGFDPDRLGSAIRVLDDAVDSGFLPGCATAVFRCGKPVYCGHAGVRIHGDPRCPVDSNTLFLIASLTKPVVCAGALLLLEEGAFSLQQRVGRFIPEFQGGLKDEVKLIHLFTHTSGLYDQIPRSRQLREAHAPINEFVQAVCATELMFPPGTQVSYQSMGILLIGEIVERLTGMRLRDYLQQRVFDPLGMTDTVLGMPAGGMERVAHSLDAPFAADSNDVGNDWNTDYWRDFGSPWGGLHSTPADLSRFLAHMLGDREGPLSPGLRRGMTADKTALVTSIAARLAPDQHWGLGWSIGNPAFGELVSPSTFGHRGATGALCWADPLTHLSCVLLTNQPCLWRDAPPEHEHLAERYSNAVAASVI